MDFPALNERLKLASTIIQIFVDLGLMAAALAVLRFYVDSWRWRRYKYRVNDWIDGLLKLSADERHPKRFIERDWRVECERMLSTAYDSSSEIVLLLETSVIVAKGIAVDRGLLGIR